MGEVISFPARPASGCFVAITRSDVPGAFDVRVWFGLPSDPTTAMVYCGYVHSLSGAAELAREKAAEYGTREIHDWSNIVDEPDGAA